jgi:hypothetical protein
MNVPISTEATPPLYDESTDELLTCGPVFAGLSDGDQLVTGTVPRRSAALGPTGVPTSVTFVLPSGDCWFTERRRKSHHAIALWCAFSASDRRQKDGDDSVATCGPGAERPTEEEPNGGMRSPLGIRHVRRFR